MFYRVKHRFSVYLSRNLLALGDIASVDEGTDAVSQLLLAERIEHPVLFRVGVLVIQLPVPLERRSSFLVVHFAPVVVCRGEREVADSHPMTSADKLREVGVEVTCRE